MKTLYIALGILVAVVAGTWLSRPAYKHWKQQRCVEQARGFLAREDYRNANLAARQALALDPSNLEATRVMTELVEKTRSPGMIVWRQRLVELEPASVTNRLRLAEAALVAGQMILASQSLQAISPTNRATVSFQEMAAMIALATNNFSAAEAHYVEAIRLAPTNRLLQLNRAVLELQSTNVVAAEAGRAQLELLAQEPALRRNALNNLVSDALRRRDVARALGYSRQLLASPESVFEDRLRHLTLLKDFSKEDHAAFLAKLQREAEAEPRQVQTLCGWLLERKLADEADRWLESLPAERRSPEKVTMARADVGLARSNWNGLVVLLKNTKWKEMDFLRRAMLSRAFRELIQPNAAEAEWRGATQEAVEQPGSAAALARVAGAWGWRREQDELLWSIVQRFPRETWALEMLQQQYTVRLDTRGLQRVYATVASFNPRDMIAKNNLAAVSLLLNNQVTQAHQMAREVYQSNSSNEVFASTYAWSLHVQGKSAEALQTMEKLAPRHLENPAIALYYGALLATNRQPEKAKLFLDIAARAKLLPEEKALLQSVSAAVK